MNPVFKPICIVLKESRKNKGISLEEVHKATKIHPHILRSLEDGTTLQLSEVYIKSYIKIYAKYLGISDDDLEQYFHPPSAEVTVKEEKKFAPGVFLKARKEKIEDFASRTSQSRLGVPLWGRMPQLKKIGAIILMVFIVLVVVRLASNSRKKVSVVSVRRQSSSEENPTAKAVSRNGAVVGKEVASNSLRSPAKDDLRLVIFVQDDTWLQVKQDGLVVFRGILRKNSSEIWHAQEKFELRTNNAGAIKLELNGKILSPLGRKGQALQKVVMTKDGLKVER